MKTKRAIQCSCVVFYLGFCDGLVKMETIKKKREKVKWEKDYIHTFNIVNTLIISIKHNNSLFYLRFIFNR